MLQLKQAKRPSSSVMFTCFFKKSLFLNTRPLSSFPLSGALSLQQGTKWTTSLPSGSLHSNIRKSGWDDYDG